MKLLKMFMRVARSASRRLPTQGVVHHEHAVYQYVDYWMDAPPDGYALSRAVDPARWPAAPEQLGEVGWVVVVLGELPKALEPGPREVLSRERVALGQIAQRRNVLSDR
jgi:hypothetical protein